MQNDEKLKSCCILVFYKLKMMMRLSLAKQHVDVLPNELCGIQPAWYNSMADLMKLQDSLALKPR